MMILRPIFVHCSPSAGYDLRFDSIMMVNGSVAALCAIATNLGYGGIAIDETFLSHEAVGKERESLLTFLRQKIEEYLSLGEQPLLFCTLLNYNAATSLDLIRDLKQEFKARLRTGVGGQLVRVCPDAYRSNPNIDHVGVGDAEVVLAQLLDGVKFATGYKRISPSDHYASPTYQNYVGIRERLDEMARWRFGPFTGIRQLITESVRGCAWANTYKVCRFCSLQSVDTTPLFRDLEAHCHIERELAHQYGLNWIFDVSNQWLPTISPPKMLEWLKQYNCMRDRIGGIPNRYVYLTTNSITRETAPLLRQAGVRVAYVGLDGWDKATRQALHKTQANAWNMLKACAENDMYIRTSFVIGSGLSHENLCALPRYVEELLNEFGGKVLLSVGNFLEIILPGSQDWQEFEQQAQSERIIEAVDLFDHFRSKGFLTLDQEDRLNELRIRHTQRNVEFEEVVEARDRAVEVVKKSQALSVTIRESEKLST